MQDFSCGKRFFGNDLCSVVLRQNKVRVCFDSKSSTKSKIKLRSKTSAEDKFQSVKETMFVQLPNLSDNIVQVLVKAKSGQQQISI